MSGLRLAVPLAALLLVACGDADVPSQLRPGAGYGPGGPTPPGVAADPSSPTATDPNEPQPGTDGGPASGGDAGGADAARSDAGTSSDAGAAGAFAGAPAYVQTAGPSSRKGAHNFAGNTPTTNPAKQACLACHSQGNGAPTFTAGGTVYKDTAGTMPAANVEVRWVDNNGAARSVYTDADGNFFFKGPALVAPGRTGARDATATRLMAGTIANGDCGSSTCHGGATGVVHVP